MDEYVNLSMMAKAAGGPEELLEKIFAEGESVGVVKGVALTSLVFVGVGVTVGGTYLYKRFGPKKAKELTDAATDAIARADARGLYTVHETREMHGHLTLIIGDRFKTLTRDGDVVMIEVDGRDDNPFFVSGTQLEQISDFSLSDIEDI
ncbi:hypothetical protein ACIQUC_15325 [Curtobacterium sp. NPDC098951]|uniref:hypothetical protein n=1 Tax=Curtobacterium sp. NPDC098951 TaxID=3363974 RepID=UPI0037FD6B16